MSEPLPPLPDYLIEQARQVPVESDCERRGAKLKKQSGPWLEGPCQACGGTNRFSVNTKRQFWKCRHCSKGGDIIALVQHLDGSTFRDAVLLLTSTPAAERQTPRTAGSPRNDDEDGQRAALWLWSESKDPRGTLAERYLAGRPEKLTLPDELAGSVIRFHGATPWHDDDTGELLRVPCMVVLMRDVLTGKPCAIQKTRLTPDGAKVSRRMRGPAKGAAIMIDAFEAVTMGLHIAEGLESAMAARVLGFAPVWALGSAGGIEAFPLLGGIASLSVFCETDDSGANERAANACADRWEAEGREVLLVEPQIRGDMADVLRRITS